MMASWWKRVVPWERSGGWVGFLENQIWGKDFKLPVSGLDVLLARLGRTVFDQQQERKAAHMSVPPIPCPEMFLEQLSSSLFCTGQDESPESFCPGCQSRPTPCIHRKSYVIACAAHHPIIMGELHMMSLNQTSAAAWSNFWERPSLLRSGEFPWHSASPALIFKLSWGQATGLEGRKL